MESTSGFSICEMNCRAYALRLSTYLRCPSAKIVSKASVDLPDPERPVITVSLFRGMLTSIFLRLCILAPLTVILSIRVGMESTYHKYPRRRAGQEPEA